MTTRVSDGLHVNSGTQGFCPQFPRSFAFARALCILIGMRVLAIAWMLAGCAELGVVSDGTSISMGQANRGYIVEGVRLPDRGVGFFTRDTWRDRGNRYGTDEMIDLITGVGRRMAARKIKERLIIADISQRGGGDNKAFHKSHQSGRDVDLIFFVRDRGGNPIEPSAMHAFDRDGKAKDESGLTVDVPRTWLFVRDLVTAPEATVQWIFFYEPLALKLLEHAKSIGEPEEIIAKARMALRQPGNSVPHNDHMHIRIYCSKADKAYGCVDFGPMDLMEARETELVAGAGVLPSPPIAVASSAPTAEHAASKPDLGALGRMLRTRTDQLMLLRRWR